MRNLIGVRLALTALGVVFATAFAAVAGYGSDMVLGTFLAGIGLLLAATQAPLAVPLRVELRLGRSPPSSCCARCSLVGGVLALVAAGAGLVPFLALQVPLGLAVLGTAAMVRGAMPLRPAFERHEWWLLVRGVLPYAAAAAIGSIYLRVTVIAMSLIASELETGYYATAFRVMEVIVAVPTLVVGATLPVLARAARDDHERLQYAFSACSTRP